MESDGFRTKSDSAFTVIVMWGSYLDSSVRWVNTDR